MKTWFITGVSRGLGLEIAKAAIAAGDRVVGSVRRPIASIPGIEAARLVTLDVTDAAATTRIVSDVMAEGQRLDIVVNNAGFGLLGPLETTSDADIADVFDVNLFGPLRIMRSVIPHLRLQGGGHIINIGSIGGLSSQAGSGVYAAAKAALEAISRSLDHELADAGVRVTLVALGSTRTDFLTPASVRLADGGVSAEALAALREQQPCSPERAGAAIVTMAHSEDPPRHWPVGSDAVERTENVLASISRDLNAWRDLSLSADFATGLRQGKCTRL